MHSFEYCEQSQQLVESLLTTSHFITLNENDIANIRHETLQLLRLLLPWFSNIASLPAAHREKPKAAARIYIECIRRNKRCILVYLNAHIDKLSRISWITGGELPEGLQVTGYEKKLFNSLKDTIRKVEDNIVRDIDSYVEVEIDNTNKSESDGVLTFDDSTNDDIKSETSNVVYNPLFDSPRVDKSSISEFIGNKRARDITETDESKRFAFADDSVENTLTSALAQLNSLEGISDSSNDTPVEDITEIESDYIMQNNFTGSQDLVNNLNQEAEETFNSNIISPPPPTDDDIPDLMENFDNSSNVSSFVDDLSEFHKQPVNNITDCISINNASIAASSAFSIGSRSVTELAVCETLRRQAMSSVTEDDCASADVLAQLDDQFLDFYLENLDSPLDSMNLFSTFSPVTQVNRQVQIISDLGVIITHRGKRVQWKTGDITNVHYVDAERYIRSGHMVLVENSTN